MYLMDFNLDFSVRAFECIICYDKSKGIFYVQFRRNFDRDFSTKQDVF